MIWIGLFYILLFSPIADSAESNCQKSFNSLKDIPKPATPHQALVRFKLLKEEAQFILKQIKTTHPNNKPQIEQLDWKLHQILAEWSAQITNIRQELKSTPSSDRIKIKILRDALDQIGHNSFLFYLKD